MKDRDGSCYSVQPSLPGLGNSHDKDLILSKSMDRSQDVLLWYWYVCYLHQDALDLNLRLRNNCFEKVNI